MAVDKLVDSSKLNNALAATADAIRAKTGDSEDIPFDYSNETGFADAVSGIETGGGVTVSPLSVTANGTYTAPSGKAYSPVTVNVSGGGGASNVVTGTFTGTTTGAAMDVTLDYSGNGYPVVVMVYVSNSGIDTFNSLIQRFAIRDYIADKYIRTTAPTYNDQGTVDYAICASKYKNSTSSGTSYAAGGGSGITALFYANTDATASSSLVVKMKSNNLMSVYIASTSYGFVANIEYTYYVIYSE